MFISFVFLGFLKLSISMKLEKIQTFILKLDLENLHPN